MSQKVCYPQNKWNNSSDIRVYDWNWGPASVVFKSYQVILIYDEVILIYKTLKYCEKVLNSEFGT